MLRRLVLTARLTAALASLTLGTGVLATAVAAPAAADTGLEEVVGPIPSATAALLPPDPKLWGAYSLDDTPDLCLRGSIRCVDDTIAGMYDRYRPLAASCHHSAVFSLLYLRVTEGYKQAATTPGYFIYPTKVNKEDTDFARLYTRAFDRWNANRPSTVPPIWRLAFAAADTEQVNGNGDALLGMAGHIKRDLPFALWRIAMGSRTDHLAINDMLKRVFPPTAAELARLYDPTIAPGGTVPGTGEVVVDAIATWRDQAWRDAQDLLAAGSDPAAFTAVAMRIERSAWDYGLTIYTASRYPERHLDDVRNAYCRGQRSS